MRIFLAEDNLADVWLIEEALKRQSLAYELDHYLTAEEAIDAARSCGSEGRPVPDLLLLDYNLPRGNGSEILAAAAENLNLANVPKAILSSSLQPAELKEARQLGASCFLTKPANLADFLREVGAAVADLLSSSSSATPQADPRSTSVCASSGTSPVSLDR